ncbi:MAG: tail protein X [Rikenellaceae bacterium]
MKVKAQHNQTLRDVCIKYYGTIEAMDEVLKNNPHLRNTIPLESFFIDLPIMEGLEIEIDKTSLLERQYITKELADCEINTYKYGTNN